MYKRHYRVSLHGGCHVLCEHLLDFPIYDYFMIKSLICLGRSAKFHCRLRMCAREEDFMPDWQTLLTATQVSRSTSSTIRTFDSSPASIYDPATLISSSTAHIRRRSIAAAVGVKGPAFTTETTSREPLPLSDQHRNRPTHFSNP